MTRVLPQIALSDAERDALRARVLAFLAERQPKAPAQVITTGRDGRPRIRLMGVWNDGFTLYTISRKPTHKLAELERDPRVTVVFYSYDVHEPDIDQPYRNVVISGRATLLLDGPSIRAMPFYGETIRPRLKSSDPQQRVDAASDDAAIEAARFGIVITPTSVRVEGFVPGPRYPIVLPV